MKMLDYEKKMDEKLRIHTIGRDESFSDLFRYPYEPTDYVVLEKIIEAGYLQDSDIIVDYGCGLGRVPIYLNAKIGCEAIGVECVETFWRRAESNRRSYSEKRKVTIVHQKAEEYQPPIGANVFFFFNPFSVELLAKVIGNICCCQAKL